MRKTTWWVGAKTGGSGWRAVGTWAVAIVLLIPAPGMAQDVSDFADDLAEKMEGLHDEYGVPGSVVSFIDDGAVVGTTAYGLADVESNEALRPDMIFEFGSLGKILTAWATMELVEDGLVDLDAPVNDYLQRMQIDSSDYDARGVTVRRLLSHTSGLSIHGYVDYSPRRANPPDVIETLRGAHLLEGIVETFAPGGGVSFGRIELVQAPGTSYRYSGAGYGVLQVLIEDVTGEPFAAFVQREITDPLGARSLRWEWSPDLEARAPTPYGAEGQVLEHRQLSIQAIGSEVGTVEDFARFVAATVTGPNGEPPGRGVLTPETLDQMMTPVAESGFIQGPGYPIGSINGQRFVSHSGANIGWAAFFILDIETGDGFVVASASDRAGPLHSAISNLFVDRMYGTGLAENPPPVGGIEALSWMFLAISLVLAGVLVTGWLHFRRELRSGRRTRVDRPRARHLRRALPWAAALLFGWYTIYSPFPVYLPAGYPDLWPTIGAAVLMVVLVAGLAFRIVTAFVPRHDEPAEPASVAEAIPVPPQPLRS